LAKSIPFLETNRLSRPFRNRLVLIIVLFEFKSISEKRPDKEAKHGNLLRALSENMWLNINQPVADWQARGTDLRITGSDFSARITYASGTLMVMFNY